MNLIKIVVFLLICFASCTISPQKEIVLYNKLQVQFKSSTPEKETYTIKGVVPIDYHVNQNINHIEIVVSNVLEIDSSQIKVQTKQNKLQSAVDQKKEAKISFRLVDHPYHYIRYYYSYKTLVVELSKHPKNRLFNKLIVLDPGHGAYSDDKELWEYYDSGAIGSTGIYESVINLAISKLVMKKLIDLGAQVIMTRESEKNRNSLRFEQRGNLVNDVLPDIFLSIHQNTSIDTSARGSVLYYSNPIAYQLANSISKEMVKNTEIPLRTLFNGKFEIMERMNIQAKVLIECAFLSNPEEEKYLIKEDNQDKIATAIVTGIINFFEN